MDGSDISYDTGGPQLFKTIQRDNDIDVFSEANLIKLTELCDMIRLLASSLPSIGLKVASVNSKAASSR